MKVTPIQNNSSLSSGPPRQGLVAETDPAAQRLCREVLENAGYGVTCVESGVAALVAAREMLPDVILVASQLRDVPGGELVRWLKSDPELQARPLILLGGEGGAAIRLRRPVSALALRRALAELAKGMFYAP